MKVSLCTITFRHHLISLAEIAGWAQANDFQGIELWAAHGRNLTSQTDRDAEWLAGYGLSVPMISDYLPLEADRETLRRKTIELCRMARRWNASKIRTFAGNRPSSAFSREDRRVMAARLREICAITAGYGIHLLVETHPNTLAETAASTLELIGAVNHPFFAINFDTLHVWEGGDDPVAVHRQMRPHIRHYHLKNIRARADLAVFAPANVYAAAGSREGMTPLFQGAFDYMHFLTEISDDPVTEVSLEWFGHDCMEVLTRDRRQIRQFVEGRVPSRRAVGL
ncbi:sugar phosphate isomerase/epimerase family protein [Pararhizobium sp.]|uniref:sugar phosphate isomerase/epimerase family protein n=1 Tax=Pararhizobium sp. TaxID=1977563 RepID=UPI0027237BE8|nr:sugar phosphate isomerase/epimerase [Pararhizobium sp.]MDO9417892.1 sugar phosphate isomerase/epimerase [Pararhizobium sp.]